MQSLVSNALIMHIVSREVVAEPYYMPRSDMACSNVSHLVSAPRARLMWALRRVRPYM